ncbi:9004_t:CDS:2, partial [Gigaspora margarita]
MSSLLSYKSSVFPTPHIQKIPDALDYDGVVNSETLNAHLNLLINFKALEQNIPLMDMRYLLRAQERYILWLQLLEKCNENCEKDFISIPPIDVCYIWHAHCLSPFKYCEDMLRLYPTLLKHNFPLQKLNHIWNSGSNFVDKKSQKIWEEFTGTPWVLDASDKSEFTIIRPWCNTSNKINPDSYVKIMKEKSMNQYCVNCSAELSADTLSVKRFYDNIEKFQIEQKPIVAGTLLNTRTGEYGPAISLKECSILFSETNFKMLSETNFKMLSETIFGKIYLKKFHWNVVLSDIMRVAKRLRKKKQLKNIRQLTISRIIASYKDIPFPFSIDLIDAVLRQREFTNKMVERSWDSPGKCHVPTLDIDLGWHTYMLYPPLYRSFTSKLTSRIINHDDTIPRPTLKEALTFTAKAWYEKYQETYTVEDPSDYTARIQKKKTYLKFNGAHLIWKVKNIREKMEGLDVVLSA